MRRGPFFFIAFHFSKWLKFVLDVPKWKFSTGKKAFHSRKKIRKNDCTPSENFPVTPLSFVTFSFVVVSYYLILQQHIDKELCYIRFSFSVQCWITKLNHFAPLTALNKTKTLQQRCAMCLMGNLLNIARNLFLQKRFF